MAYLILEEGYCAIMDKGLSELWNNSILILKEELTPVSFETWIKSLEPLWIEENVLVLCTPLDFNKEVLQARYSDLIKNSVKQACSREYSIKFITKSEASDFESKRNFQHEKNLKVHEDPNCSFLNPKYTFNTFVIGNGNRLSHAAALAVAESPAKAYNPLFIYGGVGLGKTHLMHAIGHYVLNQNPDAVVMYVSSETFTNELINSIKEDKNEEFRNKYRNADILLIDDVQFIGGKERTQEEFFHTFNTLYEANKQIILSSDRPPKEIKTLEDRLRSRFEWGLITDIQAPDLETRIAILQKKASVENLDIPDEVILLIAEKIQSNIRQLEGALNRIVAYSSLTNAKMDLDLASEALKDLLNDNKPKPITATLIQEVVSNYYGLKLEDFMSKKRTKNIAFTRQVAMYLCRELTDLSLPKIGEEFGGRDHSTVIHAYNKINDTVKSNPEMHRTIDDIKKKIINTK